VSLKPVVFRQVAERDIDGAFDYYLAEAGEKVALGFSAALERTLQQIAHHPGAGSPRPGHELDLPGLRSWSLRRFPFLVFYAEADSQGD
jgi:toxin ParE1/3/4